jgi:hypothetical protein
MVEEQAKKETSLKQVASRTCDPPKRLLISNGLHRVITHVEFFMPPLWEPQILQLKYRLCRFKPG